MTENRYSEIIQLAKEIQAIAAPTFGEQKRAVFLAERFSELKLLDVQQDRMGNVYGKISGGNQLPLVISAHMDSVQSPDAVSPFLLSERQITGPGIGDNAIGVAALIEIAAHLRDQQIIPPGDVWLVGNVGEEGLGNLAGMKQIVEKFQGQVKAYLVIEGIGLGMIQTTALGIHRYQIEVQTLGGHAWSNYGDPSAIHELVSMATKILAIKLPGNPRSSINIGSISGGGSINSLASHAELQIEIRSEDEGILESLARTLHKIASHDQAPELKSSITEIGSRPSGRISEKAPVILAAQAALRAAGISPVFAISSSDASLPISRGFPATCLGITTGRKVHTPQETIDILAIPRGMNQLFYLIDHLWEY